LSFLHAGYLGLLGGGKRYTLRFLADIQNSNPMTAINVPIGNKILVLSDTSAPNNNIPIVIAHEPMR
jgi:hypothetical protein